MSNLFDKKDVFSWANSKDARQYIGKEGYFADSLEKLEEAIKNGIIHTLIEVGTDVSCFKEHECKFKFGLFLPADKIKEPETKKWRPFKNLEEFKTELNGIEYGDVVRFRQKSDHAIKLYGGYLGHSEKDGQLLAIALGAFFYSPEKLFEHYEVLNKGEWQPFGVLENKYKNSTGLKK